LVLVLAMELAIWECFLITARPFGYPLPVATALAVLANIGLARAGARIAGTTRGALGPALIWLGVVMVFSQPGPLGDVVVPGNGRGVLFLVVGLVSAVVSVALSGVNRASRALPEPLTGR